MTTGLGTPHARSIIPALCKAVPQQPAGTFTSVNPARILDTRAKIGVGHHHAGQGGQPRSR